MILESRDTISYALAAYSDFMASLDRTSQTRKSSLCTTQFYKNIHTYLRVRLFHHNLSSPLHRRETRLSLHQRPEIRIFQTIRGRNFPSAKKKNNFQTKLASHRAVVTATTTTEVGKTPPRKYCTRTRIESGRESPNYSCCRTNTHSHFS